MPTVVSPRRIFVRIAYLKSWLFVWIEHPTIRMGDNNDWLYCASVLSRCIIYLYTNDIVVAKQMGQNHINPAIRMQSYDSYSPMAAILYILLMKLYCTFNNMTSSMREHFLEV